MCGPCWAAGDEDLSPAELERPATIESELPRTAHEWIRAVEGATWLRGRRRDAAARWRGLLTELALRANWDDHSTWPTWARLQEASGWGRSSTAAALAELQRRGWLLRLEHGSTPRFRPMALQHLEGNRAAVYQLRIPTEEAGERGLQTRTAGLDERTTWTPTHPPTPDLENSPVTPTRATTLIHSPEIVSCDHAVDGPNGPGLDQKNGGYFASRVPVTDAQRLAAGLELRDADPALRRLSTRAIRSLMKPWWRAGWTNRDLLHALEHRPTDTRAAKPVLRCPAPQLRRPDGWVRHRLSAWQDEHGPLTAPSVDAHQRTQVAATHGQHAAARLPYGNPVLTPADLPATDDERAAAAELLVRQWALEFHEQRARRRPDYEIADPDSAQHHYQQISATLKTPHPEPTRDSRDLATTGADSATGIEQIADTEPGAFQQPPITPGPPPAAADPGGSPGPSTAHERALQRARAEHRPDHRAEHLVIRRLRRWRR